VAKVAAAVVAITVRAAALHPAVALTIRVAVDPPAAVAGRRRAATSTTKSRSDAAGQADAGES
jgi:hypothetical protein